jgi:hypothetical protein
MKTAVVEEDLEVAEEVEDGVFNKQDRRPSLKFLDGSLILDVSIGRAGIRHKY